MDDETIRQLEHVTTNDLLEELRRRVMERDGTLIVAAKFSTMRNGEAGKSYVERIAGCGITAIGLSERLVTLAHEQHDRDVEPIDDPFG